MAWLLSSPQINSAFASLGRYESDTYIVNDDCLQTLDSLITRITMEDYTMRSLRRSVGFSQNIQNDLVPLLIHTNDQRVFERTIKFLEMLTIPVECLLSVHLMEKSEVGRTTMYELNQLLIKCKASLVDMKCIAAITDYMNGILEKHSSYTPKQCENILNCLTLLRNIMYIPEENNSTLLQNQLIWNLFFKNFGKLLIHLQTCPQRSYWSVAMVELTALMYKDQHVSTLQRLLRASFEDVMNESSEDNESNTTMPINRSMDSSPLLTSSDSSDNGGRDKAMNENSAKETTTTTTKNSTNTKHIAAHQNSDAMSCSDESNAPKVHKKSDKSQHQQNSTEMSDCGYGTQVDTPENQCTSSSSNDDDNVQHQVHHKPPQHQKQRHNPSNKTVDNQNKQELRKKRLLKRAKTNIIKVKGLFHQPTEADISNVLKDFTVDFLLKGYNNLVKELHSHLLTEVGVRMDQSHFYWLITYFLKFATLLELDLCHISSVLNYEIVGFLVYEAVNVCEQLESATKLEETDLKCCLRQMHLIVTAIRELLEAIDKYSAVANMRKEDKDYLHKLQLELDATEDLRCLFVLLLRCYNPKLHSKDYLTDLITTNHKLLVMLDGVSKTTEGKLHLNMIEHIRQFASVEIMYQYGFLLENFQNNGEYINDCIFTMMHHVSGDLSQIAMLFQPHILKTFSKIWDSDYEVCDDWLDLIKYVIYKFTNTTPQQSPLPIPNVLCATIAELTAVVEKKVTWTFDEMDTLFWYYAQSKKADDPLGNVVSLLKKNGDTEKTRKDVLDQLLKQDIIDKDEFKLLVKNLYGAPPTTSRASSSDSSTNKPVDDIQILVRRLLGDTKGKLLTWLQKVLMECCFVKLRLNAIIGDSCSPPRTVIVAEPMTFHSQLKNHSVPLVSWNMDQSNSMSYKPFVMLLHKLGFILPTATKMMFVRIPNFWSIRNMHDIALELGPIDKSLLKFDVSLINQKCELFDDNFNRQMKISSTEEEIQLEETFKRSKSIESFEIQTAHKSHSLINSTPYVTSSSKTFLDVVGKRKGWAQQKISEAVKVNTGTIKATELSDTFSLWVTPPQEKMPGKSQFTMVQHDSIEEFDEVDHTGEALSDCESVASDLMYVSDEDDANDFRAYLMEDVNEFFNK